MSTICRAVRDELSRGGDGAGVRAHLGGCAECATFARRLQTARRILGRSVELEPRSDFAARVIEELPRGPDLLGWAAVRLLPATLALAAVLAGWTLLLTPSPSSLLEGASATEDPLSWVIGFEQEGG